MKTFEYTLRDKEGALRRGSFQALDRRDALLKIRELGGIPVEVTEGSASKIFRFAWHPAWTRAACILGVGAVLITGVVLWLQHARSSSAVPIQARSTVPVTPPPITHTPAAIPAPPSASAELTEPIKPAIPAVHTAPVAPAEAHPASTLASLPTSTPATVHTNRPVGVRVFSKSGVELTNKTPKFTTQTDRFFWGILKNPGGTATAVLSPSLIARDFETALATKIPVSPEDDADTIAVKRQIDEIKAEIAALVKKGENLDDIIRDIQQDYNEAASTRREVRKTLFSLIKQGELETAAAYQVESNEALKKRGLDPISVPSKLLDAVQEQQ